MTLNDVMMQALADRGYEEGSLNDRLLAFYRDNGAIATTLNDAELQYLQSLGATGTTLNDAWFGYLRSLGFTGTLNDMQYRFWEAGGFGIVLGILSIGTDGATRRGYEEGVFGVMDPNTIEGTTVYEFSADETGACVLSLGDGTEQLLGVDAIIVDVEGFGELQYDWDDTNTQYEATSIPLFTYLDSRVGFAIDLFYTPLAENLVPNTPWSNASGSIVEGNFVHPTLWADGFWPPDDAIVIEGDDYNQVQFIASNNRGYLNIQIPVVAGEIYCVSVFIDELRVPSGQRPCVIQGPNGLMTELDGSNNDCRSVGRKWGIYQANRTEDANIRIGTGTTANTDMNAVMSRPMVSLGNQVRPYRPDPLYIEPLEDAPTWELVGGTNTTNSALDGELIRLSSNSGAEQAVCLVGSSTVDGGVSFILERLGTGSNTATFLGAVRVTSSDDFIGVRTYRNELQVYERVGGVWSDFVSAPNPELGSEITLMAEGTQVTLYVDGVLTLTFTTTILTAGQRGIVMRDWPNTLQPAVSRFRLVEPTKNVTFSDSFTDVDGTLLTAHTPEIGAGWLNQGSELGITDVNTAQARGTGTGTGNPNYWGNLMDVPAPVGRKLFIFRASSLGGTSLAQGVFMRSNVAGDSKIICGLINDNMAIQSWQAGSFGNLVTFAIPDAGVGDAPYPEPFFAILDGDEVTMGYGDWQDPITSETVDISALTGLGDGMGLVLRASGPTGIYDLEYADI